jgi:hypothetical protein
VKNLVSSETYWFKPESGKALFHFYQNPMSPEEYLELLAGTRKVSKEDVLTVV